jgi:hypothetical protein
MGSKNKELATQKRKQAAALKEAVRRKELAKKKAILAGKKKSVEGTPFAFPQVSEEQFSENSQIFWLCHGVNYLISDMAKGLWTPLFPEIYEGTLISPEEIAQRVVTHFSSYEKEWPIEGKAALHWTIVPKNVVYVYYKESLRRISARYPESDPEMVCKEPHNLVLWGLFNFMKEQLLDPKNHKKSHKRTVVHQ